MENNNIDKETQCFICKGKLKDARMCKDCKILFCKDCIENKYIEENKTECPNPNCQKKNRLDEMIPIPWFNDISNYIIFIK